MLDTLVGGLLGGVLRVAPEVLKFLDRKNERAHELALGKQQFEVAKLEFKSRVLVKDLEVEQSQFVSGLETLRAAINSQSTNTGIPWINAVVALVRPSVTAWIFALYSAVKVSALYMAMQQFAPAEALLQAWGPEDSSMLSAVIMFWFVGRVWERNKSRTQLDS